MRKWVVCLLVGLSVGMVFSNAGSAAAYKTLDVGKQVTFAPDQNDLAWGNFFDSQEEIDKNWISPSGITQTALIQDKGKTSVVEFSAYPPLGQSTYFQSIPITCDVDIYSLLELRVVDVATGFWKISVLDSNGDEVALSEQRGDISDSGATGTFTFRFADKAGWKGRKTFSIRLYLRREASNPVNVYLDDIVVFRETRGNVFKNVMWREEFKGNSNTRVPVWWDVDNSDPANMARLAYDTTGEFAHLVCVDRVGKWGKVFGPAVLIDTTRTHKVAIYISKKTTDNILVDVKYYAPEAIGKKTKAFLFEDTQGNQISEDKKNNYRTNRLGVFELDLKNGDGWKNDLGVRQVWVEITVEGEGDSSVDIDWVMLYDDEIVFTPPPPVSYGAHVVAVPNPFVPTAKSVKTQFRCEESLRNSTMHIYNLKGQQVKAFPDDGLGNLGWDGTDDQGRKCEGGLYLFQVILPTGRKSGQVVLIR